MVTAMYPATATAPKSIRPKRELERAGVLDDDLMKRNEAPQVHPSASSTGRARAVRVSISCSDLRWT